MSDNRAIGVFDSGLGGLTVVKELFNVLPDENIIYFGDTGRVPYGTRSVETIKKYAMQDERFLISQDVKLIIAACGTVSSVASDTANDLPVPFFEVVSHAAKAAVKATKNGRIAVKSTSVKEEKPKPKRKPASSEDAKEAIGMWKEIEKSIKDPVLAGVLKSVTAAGGDGDEVMLVCSGESVVELLKKRLDVVEDAYAAKTGKEYNFKLVTKKDYDSEFSTESEDADREFESLAGMYFPEADFE